MRYYISGKMTGVDRNNWHAFKACQTALEEKGFRCVNPHDLHDSKTPKTWLEYMQADIKALMDCQAIIMLCHDDWQMDWKSSKGALIEYRTAFALGYKIAFYDVEKNLLNLDSVKR